jgi:flagellar FliL protein
MSAATADAAAEEGAPKEGAEGEGQGKKKKKLSGKTLVLFIALPVLLLLIGGGAAFMLGVFGGGGGEGQVPVEEVKAPKPPPVFFDLPDMLVNLNSAGAKKAHFLKLNISLEIENAEDASKLKAVLPRIVDSFQVYLRDLRMEDLQGSEGVYRVREELLRRVNAATEPVKIGDVLFREMLIQ